MKKIYFMLSLLALATSCNLTPKTSELVAWEIDMLGPLAKTKVRLQDIVDQANVAFSDTLTMLEAADSIEASTGVSLTEGSTIPFLPPITGLEMPPYNVNVPELYEEANFESGTLEIKITNEFPVAIKANSKIEITLEDGTLVLRHVIGSDINVGQTYTGLESLAGKTIKNKMVIRFVDFSTGGTFTPFVVSDDYRIIIQVRAIDPVMESAIINPGNKVGGTDTVAFNLEGEKIPVNEILGVFDVHLRNGLPAAFQFQAYFLAEDKTTILDSLFSGSVDIDAATVNLDGEVVAPNNTLLTTEINVERYERLKKAKFVTAQLGVISLAGGSSDGNVFIGKSDELSVQLVGNFKMLVNGPKDE